MTALPVDFRRCRANACAEGAAAGRVARSLAGRPVSAFTHVIDCRGPGHTPRGADCSGERAGRLYIQYYLYYPGSATGEGTLLPEEIRRASAALGRPSFHFDDWESIQVRIDPGGRAWARASSHHGYNGARTIANMASDAGFEAGTRAAEALGLRTPGAWVPWRGTLYVSGGSHAGHVSESSLRRTVSRALAAGAIGLRNGDGRRPPSMERQRTLARRLERALFGPGARITPRGSLSLVPIERLARSHRRTRFAVTPPWRKRVYRDPEYGGTD